MEPNIPKAEWAPGPWHDEPDRLEWRAPCGLPALIVRGYVTGALCGYAGVSLGHPLYGLEYDDCCLHFKAADCKRVSWRRHYRKMREAEGLLGLGRHTILERMAKRHDPDPRHAHSSCDGHSPGDVLNCHGGITYAGGCHGEICHTATPGEADKVWWFGFDTAHAGDRSPKIEAVLRLVGSFSPLEHEGDMYWDIDYVKQETNELARQLAEFRGRIYCQRCGRRRRLKELYCRCGSKGTWQLC